MPFENSIDGCRTALQRLSGVQHRAGAFDTNVLLAIADVLPKESIVSLETGCGISTVMFSIISKKHYVFAYDDRNEDDSSLALVQHNSDFQPENVEFVYGPTQNTLPSFKFPSTTKLNVIFLDGPHGYPFPDLEYALLYDKLSPGGILIIDDIHIPSIGRMFDILREDRMYEEVGVFSTTGVLKRTAIEGVPSDGDHWYEQNYNVSRFPLSMIKYKSERKIVECETISFLDPALVSRYAVRAIELSPTNEGAQTIDKLATFEFDLANSAPLTVSITVNYRSLYSDACEGAYLVAGEKIVPLPATAQFCDLTFEVNRPVSSRLRLDFVHPNSISEHARGAKRYEFRRLGTVVRSISISEVGVRSPGAAQRRRGFLSFWDAK